MNVVWDREIMFRNRQKPSLGTVALEGCSALISGTRWASVARPGPHGMWALLLGV